MLVVGVKLWILQSNPGNKVAKTHCKTTSNLTVIFVSPQLRALCQLDIRRPIRRTTTNNKAWDFSCYWESTCICRIVRKNIFNKNSFDIFCWTNKRGERLISRSPCLDRVESTSHLVYLSNRVYDIISMLFDLVNEIVYILVHRLNIHTLHLLSLWHALHTSHKTVHRVPQESHGWPSGHCTPFEWPVVEEINLEFGDFTNQECWNIIRCSAL